MEAFSTNEDIESRIEAELFFQEFGDAYGFSTVEDAQKLLDMMLADFGGQMIQKHVNQKLLGYIIHGKNNPQTILDYTKLLTDAQIIVGVENESSSIQGVVVDPRYRRRGIADELLERAEESVSKSGSGQLWAMCYKGPGQPSYNLFLKHGFTPLLTIGSYFPNGEAATIVEKDL